MSEHDWKPGDVAVIRIPKRTAPGFPVIEDGDTDLRAVRTQSGGWCALTNPDYFWDADYSFHAADPRPLVVLDPDDREQVDALCKALVEQMHRAGDVASAANGVHPATVSVALRSLVSPPRPPEPTGLGAVVEDEQGRQWVRAFQDDDQPWVADHFLPRTFAEIESPTVLSEGVQ